jgi:hypothetical protein
MKLIAAAVILCAATFAVAHAAVAQTATGNAGAGSQKAQKTNQPVLTKDVDNFAPARATNRSSNNKRSGKGVAVGDVNGDGVSASRSSTIFDRWGKNSEKRPAAKR